MNEEQKYTIKKEDLLVEIEAALQDVFVAQVERETEGIRLHFPNGQDFILKIIE